ncbi:HEAT repeat domain-containing protein [Halogeometricum sp. S1BR25-6]|uniref:HEAT repeat domain-containing protein n=1 Tax=Halogeometricum salsisoli TaxID=2950536 RepID=A0ABU2GHM9_9EURY|nr:HEAT repeat domain-containing protein [Halogeometricum sp. S1BR25-6]MDS0300326.1 HEAT repeat domain-containing protein [Halogeometricum sp. S1BR25-6]
MIAIADKDPIDVSTLREAIDDLDPSVADSVPSLSTVRDLATQAKQGKFDQETVEATLDAIPELLRHERMSVHRIAAISGVVLADAGPETIDRLLARLLPMLEETVTERRTMETIEYLSTVAPDAVAEHDAVAMERLDHSRDGVARHAAGILLAVGTEAPERLVDAVPDLLAALTEDFESATNKPLEVQGGDLMTLERHSRIEHESSRLIVGRTVAAATESHPEAVTDVVLDSGASELLIALFEDQHPRVRAAATGVASHVAERDPTAFEPAIPRLIELLDDEKPVVRGNVIWTLAALDHPEAREGLRTARENDPSDELRELAASVGPSNESKPA